MENVIVIESTSGMVMEVVTKEEKPFFMVPMNNEIPGSPFGEMFYDWD